MAACARRPEDGCSFKACSECFEARVCPCGAEVKDEVVEVRVARVPDSARVEEAG